MNKPDYLGSSKLGFNEMLRYEFWVIFNIKLC